MESDRTLRRSLVDGAIVGDTYVRVAELCGRPVDVVPMNPRVLHTTAPNARATPRLTLADSIA